MTARPPAHAIHLRLVQRAVVDPGRVAEVLATPHADWLGILDAVAENGGRRYLTDLSLPVRERAPRVVFKKAAYVDLGELRARAEGGWELQISWRSSSLAPLFPVFAGHLVVTAGEIRLEGYYAPPGGEVGVALDKAFLNIAARGTGRWFLERVTEALAPSRATASLAEPPVGFALGGVRDESDEARLEDIPA